MSPLAVLLLSPVVAAVSTAVASPLVTAVVDAVDPVLLDFPASSSASLAWSEVRVDWAEMTFWASVVVSKEASACPAATCWPTVTFTAETVPAT